MERKRGIMSFFVRLAAAVTRPSMRGIDEHPAWLLRCLLRARIRKNHDGSLVVIVEADDGIGMHRTFGRLRPRLVTGDGREIPLRIVRHTRRYGLPVRCIVQPDPAVSFDADGKVSAQKLRLSFNGATKDLQVTNAQEGS